MKCNGKFSFRGYEKKEGGEFINERGQKVKYDASYVLKLDEEIDGKVYERKLKFPLNNTVLLNKVQSLKTYDEINLICDVNFYNNQVRLVPLDINLNK